MRYRPPIDAGIFCRAWITVGLTVLIPLWLVVGAVSGMFMIMDDLRDEFRTLWRKVEEGQEGQKALGGK